MRLSERRARERADGVVGREDDGSKEVVALCLGMGEATLEGTSFSSLS